MSVLPRYVIAVFFALTSFAAAGELSGIARVVDGDTLVIGERHIRLRAIDAPETDQVCLDASGERWTCGITARDRLAEHIGEHEVSCDDGGTDRYDRTLSICSLAGEDLNRWMVREGLALAYVQYSKAYSADETTARSAQHGLWSGTFIAPWDYRHRTKNTVILGAASIPITAQAKLMAPASSNGAPSFECAIKGNVNRKGQRIYHLPGQLNYAQTTMNKGLGERWFCSEIEADAAGWRKATR
jgi:endonuclease YncB( thermonuclease family)